MKRLVIAGMLTGALLGGGAHAQSKDCKDLGRVAYSATWGIPSPVSEILNDVLGGTGWTLDYRLTGREPEISGTLNGSAAHVLDKIVARLAANAVQVNYRYYPEQCRVLIAVRGTPDLQRAAVTPGAVAASDAKAADAGAAQGRWVLPAGAEIHTVLADWAAKAGWTFKWGLPKTWVIPAQASFDGSFETAIANVVEALYQQGKPVRLMLWEGNKYAEVIHVSHGE